MATPMQIEYLAPDSIHENSTNPRKHPENQLRQLQKIIEQVGFINPIIIDQNNQIIAGHARKIVASRLGQTLRETGGIGTPASRSLSSRIWLSGSLLPGGALPSNWIETI